MKSIDWKRNNKSELRPTYLEARRPNELKW